MSITRTKFAGTVVALGLIVPATALAATIQGGPRGEHLRGTNNADLIDGNGGNDTILGRGGNDRLIGGFGNDRVFGGLGNDTITGVQGNDYLNGGPGDDTVIGDANNTGDRTSFDRVYGGSGNDTSNGENGNDRMAGGTGDDVQDGGAGNDTIYANLGNDTSYGGEGDDTLWALARGDVKTDPTHPNGEVDTAGDTLDGGPGNDTFRTRDGEADKITCGDGDDTALLDTVDVIADATAANPNGSCETVVRKAPKVKDSASEDAQQAPADAAKQS